MKKTWILMMLFTSITASLCAQTDHKEDKTFEVPSDIIMNRRFYINLDKGNQLKIELTDISDLQKIDNIDSLLRVFMKDVTPLRDSFSNPLTTKRLDYVIDTMGRKRIRFQQFPPKGASFLIDNGELASLKTGQDTISIIGIITNPSKPKQKISETHPGYYHLTFYLNNMSEITDYTTGTLAQKIATLENNVNAKWPHSPGSGLYYLQKDNSISADAAHGYARFTPGATSDQLVVDFGVNIQNYKKYFVPSFSVGANLVLFNRTKTYKWEPGLFYEPNYFFANDANGKLQTYRNDFLTITYGRWQVDDKGHEKDLWFSSVFSLGYLIHREGNFMDKNTFRLGAGGVKFSKTTIEPTMYFSNFFKGVTPAIRITQRF